jgi:hypothetical protein
VNLILPDDIADQLLVDQSRSLEQECRKNKYDLLQVGEDHEGLSARTKHTQTYRFLRDLRVWRGAHFVVDASVGSAS